MSPAQVHDRPHRIIGLKIQSSQKIGEIQDMQSQLITLGQLASSHHSPLSTFSPKQSIRALKIESSTTTTTKNEKGKELEQRTHIDNGTGGLGKGGRNIEQITAEKQRGKM